ncbi:uncharacterized protein A4U43_C09F11450 [Asparagus officinalis]|uniref:Gnk2-homologous domain-containing protein n=1 Tax=Asparagus officinalis TaxID=4686 RepID=A0A5P1E728_ASPOF|nr:uncharacterized protein A4U43_C09F11450 [Asparagus officinalis]
MNSLIFIVLLTSSSLLLNAQQLPQCDPVSAPPEDQQYPAHAASVLRVLQTVTPFVEGHNITFSVQRSHVVVVTGRATCSTITEAECSSCLTAAVSLIRERCGNSRADLTNPRIKIPEKQPS